jgi:hypothetical protein
MNFPENKEKNKKVFCREKNSQIFTTWMLNFVGKENRRDNTL